MKIKKLLCVILAITVIFCSFSVIQVSAEDYEYALFPMDYMNISQGVNGSYSHKGSNALDLCGKDGGIDNVKAPFTCVVKRKYTDSAGGVTVWIQSKNKVYYADGTLDYMTMLFIHDNDTSDLYVGQVIPQGKTFFQEGTAGYATGNHVHMECGRGQFSGAGWYENSYGVWTISNTITPWSALMVSDSVKRINDYGYAWQNHIHNYNKSTFICKCGAFDPNSLKSSKSLSNVQFVITSNDAKDHTGPYGDCKSVNKYSKSTVVTAVQEVVNGYGHTWYKLSNGNYIFSDYVKKYSVSYVNIGTGTYYLKNAATGTYLSVSYGADNNEQPVNLWTSTGDDMKMVIENAPTGYKIRPYISASRLINPFAVSVVHGTKVNLYNNMNDSSQWWQFEKVGSYYVLHNVQNPSCVLDAPGGATSLVYTNNYTGASSQKWTLEPVNAPATYVIEVNGNIDYEKEVNTTDGYGTFDVYINDKLVADDVTDYSEAHPVGTKYEIKGAKAEEGRCYHGCISGNISGTLGAQRTKIVIVFASAHRFDDGTVVTPATCTTDGVIKYVCKSCAYSKTETVPGRGSHEYELSSVIHADCTQSGCKIWICKYCKDEMRENLEPYGHDYCFVDELLPTCSTEGIRLYSCSRCNSDRYEDIPMTEHNYNTSITDATCLEGAYELKECIDCGDTVKTVLSEPSEHEFDVRIDSMPTCHTEGYRMSVCIYCEMQKHETIPMIEHRWDDGTVVKNPTASETGIIAYKCTKCTAEKEEIIPVAEFLLGDVNLDGKITAADARLCLRAAARLDELSGTPRYAADYDNDNQIKAADARLILRKAAKLD